MEEAEKKTLFAQKAIKLFQITILYDLDGEMRMKKINNQTHDEVMKFRGDVFEYGLSLQIDNYKWLIIPPFDLGKITIELQRFYCEY